MVLPIAGVSNNGEVRRISPAEKKRLVAFGLAIRQFRTKLGWTLEGAEEKAVAGGWQMCAWRHLQAIEAGKKDVNLSTLFRLAKLYRTKASILLGE